MDADASPSDTDCREPTSNRTCYALAAARVAEKVCEVEDRGLWRYDDAACLDGDEKGRVAWRKTSQTHDLSEQRRTGEASGDELRHQD